MNLSRLTTAKGFDQRSFKLIAVNNVDLSVQKKARSCADLAANGGGQNDVLYLLNEFPAAYPCQITYEGANHPAMKRPEIARLGMVRSFQISAIFPDLTAFAECPCALFATAQRESYDFSWRSDRVLSSSNDQAREYYRPKVGLSDLTENVPHHCLMAESAR